jgi:serine/threonine-protein kinase
MATVYLARDLKHDREVAIKVLKPELAAVLGAERFLVEIKTTAALQHPHILPLFDSGEADGFLYYVMPFIDGETLRAKLDRETQLGVDEAVKIATEVADALQHAHEQGVVHRDIKPENILLQKGRPLVADFGIALAVSAAAGGRMTETGLSLGTPHYMSPEQATAEKEISARSDQYSLASVLYEMLAGQPPHTGASAQQIIMKIITEPAPAVTHFRKAVPLHVAAALAQALEKLPADRFVSTQAFAQALGDAAFRVPGQETTTSRGHTAGPAFRRIAGLGWGVGLAGIILSAWTLRTRAESTDTRVMQRLNIVLPDSAPVAFTHANAINGGTSLLLTPDGATLVYVARDKQGSRLYRRDLNGFEASLIAGTEGAHNPVVSPDGEWVAFFVGSELRKVPISGGSVVPLAAISETTGMQWSPDGRILVSAREGTQLAWVPETGGSPQQIPVPAGALVVTPHLLPGGRQALVKIMSPAGLTLLGAVDLSSGQIVALTRDGPRAIDSLSADIVIDGQQPRYLASGHLTYTGPTGLMAIAFDAKTLQVSGQAVEVLQGVRTIRGATHYAVSADGTLVYAPGRDAERGAFVWVSRDGSVDSLGFAPQHYGTFALSPDGDRVVAMVMTLNGETELRVYDLGKRTESTVVTRGSPATPRWWPDSRHVVFTEISPLPSVPQVVVRQLVESAGDRDTLAVGWQLNEIASDTLWAYGAVGFGSGRGIWKVPLAAGAQPVVIDSFPTAWGPTMSPDGRWIAYTSNEAGQYEIYVTESQRPGARRKVSLDGAEEPVWSPRGDELFYRWGPQWFGLSVPKAPSESFGRAAPIFGGPYVNVLERSHDVSPDGRRHLVIMGPTEESTGVLNVISHWTADVERRVRR